MKESTKDVIVGCVITGLFSVGIFFLQKDSYEQKTVETLAGYFDSVDKDMSYDKSLKKIYKEYNEVKEENEKLKKEMEDYNSNKIIEESLKRAETYAQSEDYENGLKILMGIGKKTTDIEILMEQYTTEYENQILVEANKLVEQKDYDGTIEILKEALNIIPNSEMLKNKMDEVQEFYPKNMLEVAPAYQSGGNNYEEYIDGSKSFTMGNEKYIYGMTFSADINIFHKVSWAIYNLSSNYKTLEFMVCHVDGTDIGDTTSLQIFYDGILHEEIPLSPEMFPEKIELDVTGVNQLKMQVGASGADNPLYGIGNPVLQ